MCPWTCIPEVNTIKALETWSGIAQSEILVPFSQKRPEWKQNKCSVQLFHNGSRAQNNYFIILGFYFDNHQLAIPK